MRTTSRWIGKKIDWEVDKRGFDIETKEKKEGVAENELPHVASIVGYLLSLKSPISNTSSF